MLQNLSHGQETQVLEVLVRIFDEEAEFGDTELHGSVVIGHAHNDRADALIQQGHSRGSVDEVSKGFHQLLAKSWFQGS